MTLMRKSDFAREIGVTPGRVSQMISEGLIGHDALEGEGRTARIIVETAMAQIRTRRNIGQAFGNGINTRLGADQVAEQIKQQQLEMMRRRNRMAAINELVQAGMLVTVDELQRKTSKSVQEVISAFLGSLPEMANAMATKFGIPQRDALFLIERVVREKRAEAAQAILARAAELPDTVAVEIELPDHHAPGPSLH